MACRGGWSKGYCVAPEGATIQTGDHPAKGGLQWPRQPAQPAGSPMNRSRSRSHHAFTRVELLAALLSIGVLVLMLASALMRAKAQTRRIGCISRLKNIGLSMRVFSTDNGGLFPFQRSTIESRAKR